MKKPHSQKVLFGPGVARKARQELGRLGAERVLLVTGGKSFSLSGAEERLVASADGVQFSRFSDFSPNPKLEDALKGVALLRQWPCDVILAVGGGTAIDMAKLISVFAARDATPRAIVSGDQRIPSSCLPVIAMPTTSGSGSEATHFAVVYVDGEKFSVAHESMRPILAIVDPELSYSLSPELTAVTGLDALCQSIESIWSVNSTAESVVDAKRGLELAVANLRDAVHRPTPDARNAMAEASHLAGRAINVTKTTAPHAVSYRMTSSFGVPHGLAVALTVGEFLVYNGAVSDNDVNDTRGTAHVKQRLNEINKILDCQNASESAARIKSLIEHIGLPATLHAVGIGTAADRELIQNNVNLERLRNNPRMVTSDGLGTILKKVA